MATGNPAETKPAVYTPPRRLSVREMVQVHDERPNESVSTPEKGPRGPEGAQPADAKPQLKGSKFKGRTVLKRSQQQQDWCRYLNSDKFEAIVRRVFQQHCDLNPHGASDKLGGAELDIAIPALYEEVAAACPCRLPPRPKGQKIHLAYDSDMDGYLDHKEFLHFSRTYLACLRWPKFKKLAAGFTIGVVGYAVTRAFILPVIVLPVVEKVVKKVVLPQVVSMANDRTFGRITSWGQDCANKVRIRFGDGKPWLSEEEVADIQRMEGQQQRALQNAAMRRTFSTLFTFGLIGAFLAEIADTQ